MELTWHRIIARTLLCNNEGQSHFWRKSAEELLATFIIKVMKSKNTELSLSKRVNQVFSDLLKTKSELCIGSIKKVAIQILNDKGEGTMNFAKDTGL